MPERRELGCESGRLLPPTTWDASGPGYGSHCYHEGREVGVQMQFNKEIKDKYINVGARGFASFHFHLILRVG